MLDECKRKPKRSLNPCQMGQLYWSQTDKQNATKNVVGAVLPLIIPRSEGNSAKDELFSASSVAAPTRHSDLALRGNGSIQYAAIAKHSLEADLPRIFQSD
jgi:hypothetical protein